LAGGLVLILIAFVKYNYDTLYRCSFVILSEVALGFIFCRRSRSPPQREPKARSFSPGKRKLSPKRERERARERPREQDRDRERRSRPAIASPRKRAR
jgi:hypothetical protein